MHLQRDSSPAVQKLPTLLILPSFTANEGRPASHLSCKQSLLQTPSQAVMPSLTCPFPPPIRPSSLLPSAPNPSLLWSYNAEEMLPPVASRHGIGSNSCLPVSFPTRPATDAPFQHIQWRAFCTPDFPPKRMEMYFSPGFLLLLFVPRTLLVLSELFPHPLCFLSFYFSRTWHKNNQSSLLSCFCLYVHHVVYVFIFMFLSSCKKNGKTCVSVMGDECFKITERTNKHALRVGRNWK